MYGVAPLSSRRKYTGRGDRREDGVSPSVRCLLPPSTPCKSPSASVRIPSFLRGPRVVNLLSFVQWLGWKTRSAQLRCSLAHTRSRNTKLARP